ncbi:MAG TPA: hypothetical protein VEY11_00925 [Pyrinomonadaceae bacterium]|nr:hypothetical protein [Pyrinomonadaceae bacterium]
MRHFLLMVLFAALVAIIFGIVGREKPVERFTYGTKIFVEFVGIGLALAWVLYWLPV